jgi:stage II sporulation protein M
MGKKGSHNLCWKYLKENQNYFLVILFLFSYSAMIGFFFPVFFKEVIEEFIKKLIEKTAGMNFFQLLVFIFQNNLTTAFTGLLLGLALGLFPLLSIFFNGYVLGFVVSKTTDVFGYGVLWRLIPHGIFELPALIISLGLGLKLGMFIFAKEGKRKKQLMYDLENSLRIFVFIVLPLLLAAAIIETSLMFLIS